MSDTKSTKPALTGLYVRNYAANISGNLIILLLNVFTPLAVFKGWRAFIWQEGGLWLVPSLLSSIFITAGVVQALIQRPISLVLKRTRAGMTVSAADRTRAERRLINLPIILGLSNLCLWILFTGGFIFLLIYLRQTSLLISSYVFFRGTVVGLMATFISFFVIDDFCRKKLVPLLFPHGRLASLPGTFKISILRRIRILYGAGTGAPMLVLVGTLGLLLWEVDDAVISASRFGKEIFVFTIVLYVIFVAIALSLNFLVGKSILNPIKEMMGILKSVRHGDYRKKAHVVTNDELGMLGDGMNEMTRGLLERERMRTSLNLAKEVQQALLPRAVPTVAGLDIAGHIDYCDETGGDYYDYFTAGEGQPQHFSALIGDVAGHGVSAALLMASARAFFRQRAVMPGSISQIVSDVNRHIADDVRESGAFMTLFYLSIDLKTNCLSWVRAGHDPAILYDPASGRFEELRGTGVALGVDKGFRYREYKKEGLAPGQIILMGTDGIWEAQNPSGERFGKSAMRRIMQEYADIDANGILTTCLFSLERFRDGVHPEDDATLIAIKITA